MAHGQIHAPMPNLVKPEMVIAERVANISSPATSSTMWDQLGASSPTNAPRLSGGLSTSIGTPAGTSKLMGLSRNLSLGNDRYTSQLPNLQGIPKKGMGTAMQKVREEQEVSGGRGAGANKGNTIFVDDTNFPVTLKEIIGSRLLTTEQLQKASIENVKKLISVGKPKYIRSSVEHSNGSKEENEELYYMFQRMMLEGFVRGVDITKAIEKGGGLDISIKKAPLASNPRNIGLAQTMSGTDQVGFNSNFWRNANEAERYQLFMHEVGHSTLNRRHAEDEGDIMKSGGTIRNAKNLMKSKDAYNSMLNEHFNSAGNSGTIAIAKLNNGQGTAEFDPSWFPQLSGEAVKLGGSTYNPGSSSGSANERSDNRDSFNAMFDSFRADNQAQLDQLSQQQQEMMNQQTLNSIPTAASATPTITAGGAGMMSTSSAGSSLFAGGGGFGDSTKSFAAGLANLSGGGDMSNAGMLLASG